MCASTGLLGADGCAVFSVRFVLLQTSSNHLTFEGGLARCVTNVVNPSVKQPRLGDTRRGLTTFVTSRCGEGLKLLRVDDVCNKIWARQPSEAWSSPVEWCHLFVSFGLCYALSWSVSSSCWAAWGVVPVFSRSISPCDKGGEPASCPLWAYVSSQVACGTWRVAGLRQETRRQRRLVTQTAARCRSPLLAES